MAVGNTGCEGTRWVSESSLTCKGGSGAAGSLTTYVTAGLRSSTLTGGGSYDVGSGSGTGLGNQGSTGQGSVTVRGSSVGAGSYSAGVVTGWTGCEGTEWASDSSVSCKTGAGLTESMRAVVTVGSRAGTVSEVGSYDEGWMRGVGLANEPGTGQGSVTVSGGGLGRASYSLGSGSGDTGCEGTGWVSESSVSCKVSGGGGGSVGWVVSVGSGVGSMSEAGTYDGVRVWRAGVRNQGTTGQGSLTVTGANL
eukprot:1172183-Rhodomonas_salina.1